jgi:pimeloyl-ACP methyl ester carboxylesterase
VSPSPDRTPGPGRGAVLLAADGVRLRARHLPAAGGPRIVDGDDHGRGLGFVVAHGFTGSSANPDVLGIARGLRARGGVVSLDFRGHGGSTGESTVGDLEVLDLAAAVSWARLLGYRRVVPVGWSMGAAVAVRFAALNPAAVDAVVAVSGPSRWYYRGTRPMRLLHAAVASRAGRRVLAHGMGARIAAEGWVPMPEPPDALVPLIAPVPLLLVHGDSDHYFPLDHAYWLFRAARPPAQLWIEPGFGHAETAATPALVERIAAWADVATGGSARMPAAGS